MSEAFQELGARPPTPESASSSTVYLHKSKLLTLGGDHSIALPALRALKARYGPVAVVHFDAHLDTWHPAKYPSAWIDPEDSSTQSFFNHGSMFWIAATEGLIANGSSVHAGLRTRLSGDQPEDFADDTQQGWIRIATDDIDDIGVKGVVNSIMERVGTEVPVYLSVDIDVIDPGMAPGTGTPEPGGWTTRELIRILRGIEGLNIVGGDIVEVSPAYDGAAETTGLAAAQIAYEILTSIVRKGLIGTQPWGTKSIYPNSQANMAPRPMFPYTFQKKADSVPHLQIKRRLNTGRRRMNYKKCERNMIKMEQKGHVQA